MKEKMTLAEAEKDYVEMRNRLIAKIKHILSVQPDQTVHISGKEVAEPTWVFHEVSEGDIEDCSVESVYLNSDGELELTITASYGETDACLSDAPYLFDSIKWLISIYYNICDALGLDAEKEEI